MRVALNGWALPAGTAVLCLLASLLLGAMIAWMGALMHRRWRRVVRQLALALLVPGIALASRSERLLGEHGAGAQAMFMILGVLPLLVLPVLAQLAGMLDGQVRAASGLGAGRIAILRLVWLPQLGPAALLGASLAGLLDFATLALRH